ncbi:hypothetical protein EB118_25815 [bacterium]|nr:hypothetical protein [bacterium]NDD85658.1 hypothetical protein [bacterium]NDG33459.1 hypothetical protein [bacterium]
MACKNCPPVNRDLRIKIAGWLAGGYDYNKVAALLNCSYDLVVDVAQNGVGEEEPIEYFTENQMDEDGNVMGYVTTITKTFNPDGTISDILIEE